MKNDNNNVLWVIAVVMFMLYFCTIRGFNEQNKNLCSIVEALQQQNQILGYDPTNEMKGE